MKRLKSEKGVITMITLVTVLFMISFLISSYIIVANKVRTQKEMMAETKSIYEPKSTMEEILNLLQDNARLALEDIAAMTKKTVEEVAAIIAKLENDGVILKYAAIVNPEKDPKSKNLVQAVIEIQVTPEREHGFDAIAERIYRFPQVKSLYLMSGGYDLQVIIEGESLQDVSFFVARKLSTLNGVRSTKTHFVLKTYKENEIVYVDEKKDSREGVTA